MVTNSYLGEYVVDINTPLLFFPRRKIDYFLNEDNPVTGFEKTPFLFLPQPIREKSHPPEVFPCLPWKLGSLFTQEVNVTGVLNFILKPRPTYFYSGSRGLY